MKSAEPIKIPHRFDRVATNLEKPEYSRISLNLENSGILREFCAISGKSCNKQSIFSLSFNYLCKTAVSWVNGIVMTLDEGHYYKNYHIFLLQ